MTQNTTTDDQAYNIAVAIEVEYVDEQSIPQKDRYVYAYHVTIKNEGEIASRLLTRHWIITDANGKKQEVRGPGVVGEHPHLQPGEEFSYSSFAIIETPIGSMQGSYQMKADDGVEFDAEIAPFSLSQPSTLH